MSFTLELMDAAKKAQGITSDYRLAQLLGVVRNTVSNWRCGRSFPDYSMTCALAKLAGHPEGDAVLGVGADRLNNPKARETMRTLGPALRAEMAARDTPPGGRFAPVDNLWMAPVK